MTEIIISTPTAQVIVSSGNVEVTIQNSDITTSIIGIPGGLNVLGTSVWGNGALIYFDQAESQFVQDAEHLKWDDTQKKLIVKGSATVYEVDAPTNFVASIVTGIGGFYDNNNYNFEFKLHAYKDTSLGRVYSAPVTSSVTTSYSYSYFNFNLSWDLVSGADGYIILVVDPYTGYTGGDYGFALGVVGSCVYDYYSPTLTYYGTTLSPTALSGVADPLEMVTGCLLYTSPSPRDH
jgi:hypothetical protein